MTAVGFVALAIIGTLMRAGTVHSLNRPAWPSGTLIVNTVGAGLLGLLGATSSATVTAVGVGGLGAFTTFSTVAQEIAVMVRTGRALRGVLYGCVTFVAGTAAAVIGLEVA